MTRALLANNASTTLSAAITTTGATTFTVASAAAFPAPTGAQYFYVTLLDSALVPEVVKVTNVTTLTFTCVRGQDGTAARTFLNGASVKLMANKAVMDEFAAFADPQSWSAPQRGTQTTDNDLSFDLNATNNFKCTPTAGGTLTFTNIASATGQSGFILLVNGSNYAISAAATTKVGSSTLATISTTGTYLLSYYCDGTNVYVTASGALA